MEAKRNHSYIQYILGIVLIAGLAAAGWWFFAHPKEGIYSYNPSIDRDFIINFYKDKENWYWMLTDYTREYSIERLLDFREYAGEPEYNGKLIIKTYRINNKPVGFSVFFPKELFEGAILFIAVDKEHRKKGIARKLTVNAIDELKKGGAQVIRLWTRADNVKARTLYESLGFKLFWTDGAYVRYEKYLTKS